MDLTYQEVQTLKFNQQAVIIAFTGIVDVSQNDYFQVAIYIQSGTTIAETDANFSWFELEVVEGSILGGLGNLSTLQDVHNASPTDGQALVWDNSNSYWGEQ